MSVGYIQPDSIIKLLFDVPLDPNYEHTLYFNTGLDQYNYFASKVKVNGTFTAQYYQRSRRGFIRLEANAEYMYNVNYLMFQNNAFGNKWFYAFVVGVDYVNNNVCEIQYALDIIQTWYFEAPTTTARKCYTLRECFVERQHTETDDFFENLVPEDLALGDSFVTAKNLGGTDISSGILFDSWDAIVLASQDYTPNNTATKIGVYRGIYSPLYIAANEHIWDSNNGVDNTGLTQLEAIIDAYVSAGHEDSIVTIYIMPHEYALTVGTSVQPHLDFGLAGNFTTIDGYTVKNKKLFTSPYNYVYLTSGIGVNATYKFEDWVGSYRFVPTFDTYGCPVTTPQIMCQPKDGTYNKSGLVSSDNGIILQNFPVGAWIGDVWAAWWAQSKGAYQAAQTAIWVEALSKLGTDFGDALIDSMGTAARYDTGLSGGRQTASSALNIITDFTKDVTHNWDNARTQSITKSIIKSGTKKDLQNTPPTVHGQTQADSFAVTAEKMGFTAYQMTVRAETAKIIDDYFTRYGYAIHTTRVPNTHARPYFTYVKTVGCTAVGNCPASDLGAICKLFDKGITWWTNADFIGRYSELDNSPTQN